MTPLDSPRAPTAIVPPETATALPNRASGAVFDAVKRAWCVHAATFRENT